MTTSLLEAINAREKADQEVKRLSEEIVAHPHPGDTEMAEALHSRECRASHEDMCSWEWDKHHAKQAGVQIDWTKDSRRRWLLRGHLLRESGITVEQLTKPDEITRLVGMMI